MQLNQPLPPPPLPAADPVEALRAASRRLVRAWGFLGRDLAGSGLPPSSVHALIEIGAGRAETAGDLAAALALDKSTVSRLLAKLVAGHLVDAAAVARDGRMKRLALTEAGRRRLGAIDLRARAQVAAALARLDGAGRQAAVDGLALYAGAVEGATFGGMAPAPDLTLRTDYRPGLVARCLELHAAHYARAAGFGRAFEAAVAAGLADYAPRFDSPVNRFWHADAGGRIVATLAIDGEDLGGGRAHLRWFIVEDGWQGQGIGRRLLAAATDFCDRQGVSTELWTFAGLDAARHLYEAAGFRLADERPGRQWGSEVLEQRFVRPAPLDRQEGSR